MIFVNLMDRGFDHDNSNHHLPRVFCAVCHVCWQVHSVWIGGRGMTRIENLIMSLALAALLSVQWDMPPEPQALIDVAAAAETYPLFAVEDTK